MSPAEICSHQDTSNLNLYFTITPTSSFSSLKMSAPAAAGPGPAMAHLRWEERNQALQTSILEDRALGAFSDTTIRCRDQTVRAHKLVLAASSSFLADILRGCAEAAAEEECVLLLPDLEAAALASLLEAVYSGARLDRWSLASEPVLAAAETLGMLGTETSEQFSVSLGLDTLELYTGSFSGTKVFILNNFFWYNGIYHSLLLHSLSSLNAHQGNQSLDNSILKTLYTMWWAADFKPIAGQFSKSLRRKLQKEALEETGEQNSKRNFQVKVNSYFKERWQVSATRYLFLNSSQSALGLE